MQSGKEELKTSSEIKDMSKVSSTEKDVYDIIKKYVRN